MKRVFLFSTMIVTSLVSLSVNAVSQDRPQPPPRIKSLEVKEDRTVVARIYAPNAKEVRFSSSDLPSPPQMGRGIEMKKGDNGVWEGSSGPVEPGSYRYNFQVDSLTVLDPNSPETSASNSNTWSLFHVPGSAYSDLQDVPHGAVAKVQYHSKSLNRFRTAHVYTPPSYNTSSEIYPVLYLLHGASDSDNSWSTIGRAGLILDNLIAENKAKPMVVVMPMGHTGPFSWGGGGGSSFQDQMKEFQTDFESDLRPYVEANYRLKNDRGNRAIAGLSMGGAQTLNIAMKTLSDYGYVGVFSSGVFGIAGPQGDGGKAWIAQNESALKNKEIKSGLKLVWFATGKEDFLLSTTQGTVQMLKDHEFDVTYEETDGGHTWIKWREHYLPTFTQKLFQ
jgi:enterochelin esterase family protein